MVTKSSSHQVKWDLSNVSVWQRRKRKKNKIQWRCWESERIFFFVCGCMPAWECHPPLKKKKKNPICPPLWVFSVISEEEQTHVEESVPFMASLGSVFLVSLSCKWWMSDCTNVCSCQSAVVRFPPLCALTYHHTHTQQIYELLVQVETSVMAVLEQRLIITYYDSIISWLLALLHQIIIYSLKCYKNTKINKFPTKTETPLNHPLILPVLHSYSREVFMLLQAAYCV